MSLYHRSNHIQRLVGRSPGRRNPGSTGLDVRILGGQVINYLVNAFSLILLLLKDHTRDLCDYVYSIVLDHFFDSIANSEHASPKPLRSHVQSITQSCRILNLIQRIDFLPQLLEEGLSPSCLPIVDSST